MREIETYYLIDYENVGSDGLSGCDKLKRTDHILIFFTENAKKIDMSEIANHGDSDLDMIKVPAGKQSADIHIGSYLGYLAGTNKGKDCKVVIVSKDTDFDNVIKFWGKEAGVKASRSQQIKASAVKATKPKQSENINKKSTKVDSATKTKLNQEVMKAVSAAGFEPTVSNKVAQIAANTYGSERLSNDVHNVLRGTYNNYLEVYEVIKPVLSKYDKSAKDATSKATSTTVTSKEKIKVNADIMQTLAKAGCANDIVTYVASTVVKNLGVKGGKQLIYRDIISHYGQSKGLDIYNHIKTKI